MGSDGLPYEKRVDKKGKVLSDTCLQDEVPFEIPNTWTWARLGSIGTTQTGKTPPTGNRSYYRGNIPFVTPGDITYSHRLYGTARHLSTSGLERSRKAAPGSVLQVCIGGSSGKTCLIDFDCAFNQQINHVSCTVSEVGRYLYCVLISPLIQNRIKQIGSGTATPITNKTKWESFLIPLPPLGEQQRIVERVRDLLPLVEEYGDLEDEREALDHVLPDKLRKSILQQAVEGKLVAQDPGDEDASILVERIRKEKHRLITEGKAKFPKGGESIIYTGSDGCHYEKRIDKKGKVISDTCIQDEIPFEIPNTWTWARLGSVTSVLGGATPDKGNPAYWGGNIPWASMKDIHGNYLESTIDSITRQGLDSKPSLSLCEPNDVIVSTRLIPGKSVISKIKVAINQDLKVVKTGELNTEYIHLWFQSNLQEFKRMGSGTTVPGIKLTQLLPSLIPLPPLAEQQRIVDRVRELLSLCCESGTV